MGREAHAKIGEQIARQRDGLQAEISKVRTDLGAEIAELREGQTALRAGLAEIRGELTGVTRAVDTLRQDFRAHVLGPAGAGS